MRGMPGTSRGTAVLIVALASVVSLRAVRAQAPSPSTEPTFEVASLKLAKPDMSYGIQWGRNTWSSAGPKRLVGLLGFAYDVSHYAGLPDWNATEWYTVDAKAEDGVLLTRETLRPRLRQLLVERFKLATHVETTLADGYALVLAKGGPRLKATTNLQALVSLGNDRIRAPSVDMATFAKVLTQVVQQPVADQTGLAGTFDFTMTFAPVAALDSPLPSIFTALDEQLGLKLESGHKVPVETLVIDHVEHPTVD